MRRCARRSPRARRGLRAGGRVARPSPCAAATAATRATCAPCTRARCTPLTGAYPEDEYWEDLLKVTGGLTDEQLARMTIRADRGARAVDEAARRALPGAARRHAAPLAHQRVLPRRRQGAGERVLPRGRGARRRDPLRDRGRRRSTIADGRFESATVHARRRAAREVAREGGGRRRRRLRVQPRVAARGLGPARRQLHRARHALQPRQGAEAAARRGREVGERRDAGPLRGDRRARARSSTAAS